MEEETDPPQLTRVEWMEVLGDVYRAGVADGQRIANLELLEQISGPELMRLGRTLRHSIHEALEDAAGAMESLWNDHNLPGWELDLGLVCGR